MKPILALNDEAHHYYPKKPAGEDASPHGVWRSAPAGRGRSASRVQVPGGVQGGLPGDRRAVLALRKPQFVELFGD